MRERYDFSSTTTDGALIIVAVRNDAGEFEGGLVGNVSINGFGAVVGMILDTLGRGVGFNGKVRCEVSSFGLSPGGGIPSRISGSCS